MEKKFQFYKRLPAFAGIVSILLFAACSNPAGPENKPSTPATYTVTITQPAAGGSFTVKADNAEISNGAKIAANKTLTLSAAAGNGYSFGSFTVTKAGGENVPLSGTGGTCTFTMPAAAVTVTANFIRDDAERFAITIDPDFEDNIEADLEEAAEGIPVTLTVTPPDGMKLSGSPLVTWDDNGTDKPVQVNPRTTEGTFTFTMPGGDVSVTANFVNEDAVIFEVKVTQSTGGNVIASPDAGEEGDPISLTWTVDKGYRYEAGKIAATWDNGGTPAPLTLTPSGNSLTFDMPAGDVTVTTAGAFAANDYTITIDDPIANGSVAKIEIDGVEATGTPVTARYNQLISLTVTADSGFVVEEVWAEGKTSGNDIDAEDKGSNTWTFTMPGEDVTVYVLIESEGATGHAIVIHPSDNGTVTVDGGGTTAEASTTVTLNIAPDPPYKLVSLVIHGDGATNEIPVTVTGNTANFTMPNHAVTVTAVFGKPGTVKIYSNGEFNSLLNANIALAQNVVQGNDYQNSLAYVDIKAEVAVPKNKGHDYAIEVKREGPGRADVAFSLISDTKIDLSGTSGLSFMVYYPGELGGGWFPFKWVGFGDSNIGGSRHVVWYGPENNANFLPGPNQEGWHRVIVPVPKVSDNLEVDCVFSLKVTIGWNGEGTEDEYYLIDDIEFLAADAVALSGIVIPSSYPAVEAGTPLNAVNLVTPTSNPKGIRLTYTTTTGGGIDPAVSVITYSVNIDPPQGFDAWGLAGDYEFQLSNANASLSGTGGSTTVTPVAPGESFDLSLKIGAVTSNTMTVPIISDNVKMIEDFESGNESNDGGNGYWKTFGWSGNQNNAGVAHGGSRFYVYKFVKDGHEQPWWGQKEVLMAGRNFPEAMDLSGFDEISFRIMGEWNNNAGNTQADGLETESYSFMLSNDAIYGNANADYYPDNTGDLISVDFTFDTHGSAEKEKGYTEIRIPLQDFVDKGLDPEAVTGWAFSLNTTNTVDGEGEYGIRLDDIIAEK